MMGTTNTAWKLTDLWNVALFTFDSSGGWHPTNENQTAELTGEIYNIPWSNHTNKIDFGLGARQITLQGIDVADKDMWSLSSTIAKRQLMKLWVGEDWFYYVLGVEPRQIRDQSLPVQKSYIAAFMAVDPHYYFSNSSTGGTDATINQVGPTTVIGSAWSTKQSSLTIALTGSGADEGTTNIEPMYWIIGGASTSIEKIAINDEWMGQIDYTPTSTITNGHVHVIMPWRNILYEGFVTREVTGFKVVSGTSSSYITEPAGTPGGSVTAIGTWAMDAFNHGVGTDVSSTSAANTYGFIEEEVPGILTRGSANFIRKNRYYPVARDGVSNTHTVTVATGTETDAEVFAQYCLRRV